MAEQVDVEVIRVDTGKAVDNLKELNEYIKELKKTMNEAKIGSGEFKEAQDELDKVIVKQKQIMNGAANENKAAAGSFNALSNQLRELKEAWKATADEAKRDELGKQINDVKAKLNDMNHSIGNFQDQVGNYNGMLSPLFDSLGQKIDGLGGKLSQMTGTLGAMGFSVNGLVNPIKAVDSGFKLLSTNPIIAAMTLLIGLFLKVKDAIAANEELQRRWNVAMAAFQPIINAAKNALDALANAVVWVAEKVGALISLFSEASKKTTELAKAQDELNMSKREFKGNENAMRAEAKALKLQAKETDDLNEKLRLLNESRAKLKATNQQAVDLAAEELRIAEEQAKLAPNSQEDNEKIAALKQKVGQAQEKLNQEDTEYVELIKSADNGLKKLNTTTGTAVDKTKELAKEVEKMEQTIADSSKSQVQKLEEEKNKWVENYKQLKKNTKALEEYYDKKIEGVKKTEEQNRGKLIQSIDINWISGGSGSRKAGVDIAKEWNEQFRQITSTLQEPQLTEAKTKLAEIFRNQIFKQAWPTQAEVDKEVVAYFNKITGGIDSSTTNTALKEIAQLIQEKTADALKDAGQKTNLNLLDILGFKQDEDGRILFPKEPKQDEETLDLLKGKLKALKEEYFALAQEVASGKSPIPTEKLLGVADKAEAIEELQKIIALFEEIRIRYNAISDLSAAKSGNQLWTERFFGTKTDANGFATDGERLGKALRNTTKVWQDYGDAVTTVLDTIGDAWQKNLERQVKAGKMTEDEAKKQFKMIQAMQYSLSVINAAASLINIWSSPEMGIYQKIATTVAVAAQNAAELVTIATTQFGDMSNSASVGAAANYTPAVINDTNPVSYTRNLTSAEDVDSIADRLGAIKVYVTEKDITDAQNKVRTKVSESRF